MKAEFAKLTQEEIQKIVDLERELNARNEPEAARREQEIILIAYTS